MATNPIPRDQELSCQIESNGDECTFHCSGRLTSHTVDTLKSEVKPAIPRFRTIVLDLSNVSYMDSSGLGTVVGLYVSAKAQDCLLKVTNLNKRLKELFSLTRLGEVLTAGRDPNYLNAP